MEILSNSTQETEKLAKAVAKELRPGMVLALYGDLGSGKTTFVSYLVKALGFECRVQSPTFVIHRQYVRLNRGKNYMGMSSLGQTPLSEIAEIQTIHHIDLYRLTSEEEVLDLGLSEILSQPHSLVLIEWPELAKNLLPSNTINLRFIIVNETTRRIVIEGIEGLSV